ncbi:hypothetical protein BH23DEI1_BH23DEI1_22810 [soil metagenome]
MEALLVIEVETGMRERTTLPLVDDDPLAAARRLGRHLARSGTAVRAGGFRLRVERAGALHDESTLAKELLESYRAERRSESDS